MKTRNWLRGAVLAAIVAFIPAVGEAQQRESPEAAPSAAAQRQLLAASVGILNEDRHAGSGWIGSDEGLVITACHVVGRPGRRLEVLLGDERLAARLVAVDRGHDLALLALPERQGGYPSVRLSAAAPPAGSLVFLSGVPLFRPHLLLPGRVARGASSYEFLGDQGHYIRCLHIASMSPRGVSGGPWVNQAGEVIALQSGSMTLGPAIQGVSFATPASAIEKLLSDRQTVSTPTLGAAVEETWQQDRRFLDRLPRGTRGLVVRRLEETGPAARGGLKMWDVVQEMEGTTLHRSAQLLDLIRQQPIGKTVRLTVLDANTSQRRIVEVVIGALETGWK